MQGFGEIPPLDFGGDMITVKFKAGRQRPYSSIDRNHIRACTTRQLWEQLGQVSKTSSPKGNDRSPESNVPMSNLI